MTTANEKLQSQAISHQVDLQHYSNGEVRKIIALLNRADADLVARLDSALQRLDGSSFTVRHMTAILSSVRELNREIFAELGETLQGDLGNLAQFELDHQAASFSTAIPGEVLAVHPLASVSMEQVRNIAFSRPFQGRLLSEWLDGLEQSRTIQIRDAIRIGMVEGQNTSQIVQRIRGTRAEGYADGLLQRTRRDVETIVRTAVSHVSGVGRDAFYGANTDLIKAERWLSTLDGRTTPACRIRDNLQYTPVEHKPIGHKVPWLSGPGRLHMCCRSMSVPVTKSWRELGLDFDEINPSTRASMDGQVPADMSYAGWLKGQSPARQDQILGPTRGKLYRDGKLEMDRFYNDKGRFLTLEQLAERGDIDGLRSAAQPMGTFSVYDAGHPVSVADASTRARAKAVEIENAIRKDTRETGAFISSGGDVLLQRQGDVDRVAFPTAEFPGLAGSTFTHNHPGNSTFSRADILLAAEIGLTELRAVGPTLRHIMAPAGGWPSASEIEGAVALAAKAAQNRVTLMINQGELEPRFAQAEFDHQVIAQLAKALKLKYTRERS